MLDSVYYHLLFIFFNNNNLGLDYTIFRGYSR
uniref:Uncharacterized protein n=1 Tax=Siphoviridae sp. ct0Wl9 TaxID=2827763 RepID=A0A8S5T9N1_9CAUD|nr:MAG TPA: hypothetical protein [Siphoviridae sp. ct0Wl9]